MKQRNTTNNDSDYDKDENVIIALPNEKSFILVNELVEHIINTRSRNLKIVRLAQLIKKNLLRLRPYNAYRDSLFIPLWWLELR